jgi:hypothetical protein
MILSVFRMKNPPDRPAALIPLGNILAAVRNVARRQDKAFSKRNLPPSTAAKRSFLEEGPATRGDALHHATVQPLFPDFPN